MKAAIREAIEAIKSAGFSHIKVELEGDLGRDGERECSDCYGEGRVDCDECNENGMVETHETVRDEFGDEVNVFEECGSCYGDTRLECETCEGEGNLGSFMDEDTCDQFMRDHVPAEVLDRLVHGHFYEDGSVDSEFTFTVATEDAADVLHWIDAFKALGASIGEGIDVRGAGMHISLLTNAEYRRVRRLNPAGLDNFTSEVTRLLPALFFVASAGHQSRNLHFRQPQISHRDKYSAIYTHDRYFIEYRLFETCYDRPEAFWEYLQAIAQTLKFYVNPSLKVRQLGREFGFNDGRSLARFYNTPEQLRILNATVKEVKPKDKSFKKMKEDRGVRYTIKALSVEERAKQAQLKKDYDQYVKQAAELMRRPLTNEEQRSVDYRMVERGMTRDQAVASVRGARSRIEDFTEFVNNNTRNVFDATVMV